MKTLIILLSLLLTNCLTPVEVEQSIPVYSNNKWIYIVYPDSLVRESVNDSIIYIDGWRSVHEYTEYTNATTAIYDNFEYTVFESYFINLELMIVSDRRILGTRVSNDTLFLIEINDRIYGHPITHRDTLIAQRR